MISDYLLDNSVFEPAAPDENTELNALANALRLAKGFKLFFVRCNLLQQRLRVIRKLKRKVRNKTAQWIHLDEPVSHLLDEIRSRISDPPPDAVFVSGIENSLRVAELAHKTAFVANLNASRNSFEVVVPCPLFLWIPDYVLTAIMNGAPDFFSIRSGVYFFSATPRNTDEIVRSMTIGNRAAANLSIQEKESRVIEIEHLLAEYESLAPDDRNKRAEVRLHRSLGYLLSLLGRYERAERHFLQALALVSDFNDLKAEFYCCLDLVFTSVNRGDLEKAEEYCSDALRRARQLEDKELEGATLTAVARLRTMQGRFEEAKELYLQGLNLQNVQLDSLDPSELNNLGNLYAHTNDLSQAELFYRKAVERKKEDGDIASAAGSLVNLGNVYYAQGRISEAEDALKESLGVARDLGLYGIEYRALRDLGNIRRAQNDISSAINFYKEALLLSKAVGDSKVADQISTSLSRLNRLVKEDKS
jgi:tetratricopeptide (TPR) repeat protein